MKKIIISLLLLASVSAQAGLFDNGEEKKRRQEAEQKLEHQRELTGQWQLASGVLGTTCVALLVVGAAIGAKARKAVKHE